MGMGNKKGVSSSICLRIIAIPVLEDLRHHLPVSGLRMCVVEGGTRGSSSPSSFLRFSAHGDARNVITHPRAGDQTADRTADHTAGRRPHRRPHRRTQDAPQSTPQDAGRRTQDRPFLTAATDGAPMLSCAVLSLPPPTPPLPPLGAEAAPPPFAFVGIPLCVCQCDFTVEMFALYNNPNISLFHYNFHTLFVP
jgi:hypothetical protein